MTEKLYDLDAYATEFKATVLECVKENDIYKVTLDKTLFFPEEGGQSPDKGTINGIEVLDVKIKENIIYHFLSDGIAVGEKISGKIDFEHRFKNMQMHSGEHIFSGLSFKKYGYNNVGFHLSENSATIDLDGKLSLEQALILEKEVNEVIVSNREIKAYYPSEAELERLDYRSKKALTGAVRIVIIPDADICACCAPHVHRTGEIGIFKIISIENYKGGVRLNYRCGFRALKDFEDRIEKLQDISRTLNIKSGEEAEGVRKLFEENRDLKYKNLLLNNKLIENQIKASMSDNADFMEKMPLISEKITVRMGDTDEIPYMKYTMDTLHRYFDGICILLCGNDSDGYRYLAESDVSDMNILSGLLKEKFGAKGGGKKNSVQGTINAASVDILNCIKINYTL